MTTPTAAGQNWWHSEEGLAHRDFLRSITTVRIGVEAEPRSKSSRGNNQLKARLLSGNHDWHRPPGWPRPNADVALDAWATTDSHTVPDVQNFCKWLLDELGGRNGDAVVFRDDRQVKMLFARVDKWSNDGRPNIWVDAQRVSLVKEGLRRAADVARRSEVRERLLETMAAPAWVYTGGDVEQWVELYDGDDSEFGRDQLRRARYAAQFQAQHDALAGCDELAAQVLLAYSDEQSRAEVGIATTADMLGMLSGLPYTINLGRLPEIAGGNEVFRADVRSALSTHAHANRLYFPLLHEVGLTVFYIQSRVGKDLDNIFRVVAPIVLDVIKPPAESVSPFAEPERFADWDDVRQGRTEPPGPTAISFIQAVAMTIDSSAFTPGTVVLVLTPGMRHQSLWRSALDTVDPI